MYKDLDYSPESYASAVNYANRLNSQMESAKSECLGILSGLNPPADLDISGEVSSLRGIIESMSTRVGEIRTIISDIRDEIESRNAEIASKLDVYINNEKAYIHNTEKDRIVGSKPNPKDYADGVNDEAYIKDLEKYNKTLAAYEAFTEGKIDYNYLKSTYGEEIATEVQKAYGKEYSGWQEGEGKSIVEGVSGVVTTVKDVAVLLVTDPVEFYVRTEATIANAVSAGLNGMLNTVENAVDLVTAVGGAVGSGVASWTGHEETSKKIRENTSSFISTEWVDTAYDMLYSTAGGKWLDSKSVIKYDSQIFNAIADIGKTGGLIGLSIVASPAVGALMAGASAGGETIEKDFQNMGGTVTDVNAYNQALIHGLAAGALEGGMWYAGAKVGLSGDLALSVADPVSRTGVQMLSPTENRSFKEIFNEDYGGAKGIITNMAFSILGNKFSDRFSATKNVDIETNTKMKPDIEINGKNLAEIEAGTSAVWNKGYTIEDINSSGGDLHITDRGFANLPQTYGYKKAKWYQKLSEFDIQKNDNAVKIAEKVDDISAGIEQRLYKAGITDPDGIYFFKKGMSDDLVNSTAQVVRNRYNTNISDIPVINQEVALSILTDLDANLDTYVDYQLKRQEILNWRLAKKEALETPGYRPEYSYYADNTLSTLPYILEKQKDFEKIDSTIKSFADKYDLNLKHTPNSAKKTYVLANEAEFRQTINDTHAAAYNTLVPIANSQDKKIANVIPAGDDQFLSRINHEEIHGVARRPDGTTGFKNRGMKEATTEWLNKRSLIEAGEQPGTSGYDDMVKFVDNLYRLINEDEVAYAGQNGIKVIGDAYFADSADESMEKLNDIFRKVIRGNDEDNIIGNAIADDLYNRAVRATDDFIKAGNTNNRQGRDQAINNLNGVWDKILTNRFKY